MFVGIDLGSHRIHVVALNDSLGLANAWVMDVADIEGLPLMLTGARVVAIDAPESLSTAPHADDGTLSRKFRSARCAEIALGRERAIWVPWVTPTKDQPCPGWMKVGFQVFELARRVCDRVIEVFPHAGFRTLAGGKVPSKQTAAGLVARAQLLEKAGVKIEGLEMWSHDSLDACLAALIGQQADAGMAETVTCAHDGSAMWLPRPASISP